MVYDILFATPPASFFLFSSICGVFSHAEVLIFFSGMSRVGELYLGSFHGCCEFILFWSYTLAIPRYYHDIIYFCFSLGWDVYECSWLGVIYNSRTIWIILAVISVNFSSVGFSLLISNSSSDNSLVIFFFLSGFFFFFQCSWRV